MEEKHYIEWIEVRTRTSVFIKALLPGDKPEAEFCVADTNVKVRAFCNVHGLWTNRL
ncbi:MAG TPA: desulfoferrodoxin family protein [Methanoregula sp.]|nr:desulfoferrodoxin family protein [Methanoregula sp.]